MKSLDFMGVRVFVYCQMLFFLVRPAVHNSTSIRPRMKVRHEGWSRGLIIGLSASGALVMCVLGCCFIYCIFQKRNRKLQLEFDTRYELKKKYELDMLEECASKR